MKQLQLLLLLSAMIFMITCKDPITKYSARFTCNEATNNSKIALTVDINEIHIHFPDNNETIKMNMLDRKNFNKTQTHCAESTDGVNITQKLSLSILPDHLLSLEFLGNSTVYHVEKVEYTKVDQTKNETFTVTKPGLHMWHHEFNEFKSETQGYKCGQTVFKLTEQSSPIATAVEESPASSNDRKVEIKLNEFMFVALQNGTSTADITRMRCRVKPKNSNIPYYVGGGLLGVAAVVVVIYFVMRKMADSKKENEGQ